MAAAAAAALTGGGLPEALAAEDGI